MTGQIDIGWSVVPFALKDVQEGKIRIVARASEAKELQNQTIRVNLANVNSLKTKREAITKFMQVIHKSIDWAYTNPQAIEIFAKNMKVTPEIAKQAVDEFYPKSAMQIGEIRDLERSLQGRARLQVHPVAEDAEGRRGPVRHRLQAASDRRQRSQAAGLADEIDPTLRRRNLHGFRRRVTYPQRLHSIAARLLFRLGGLP